LQAVSAPDEQTAWASGVGGTYIRTTDGGRTWIAGVVPGAESLEFRDVHALDAKTAWLLSAGPADSSRIYKTTDGGRHWLLQFTNSDPQGFYDCLGFWDAKRGLAVGDAVGGQLPILITGDGGSSWARVPTAQVPPALKGEGAFAASGTCLITLGGRYAWIGTGAGERARVLATVDGGNNWTSYETPIIQGTATTGITSLAFRDQRNGLAVGGDVNAPDSSGNNVAWTIDGGATWELGGQPTFPGPIFGAFYVPGAPLVVAVGPGGASFSRDDGQTWALLDTLSYWSAGFASVRAGWLVGPGGRVTRVEFGKH
jgi:photosystem II stability/assembly factor-like uncharacterized protein